MKHRTHKQRKHGSKYRSQESIRSDGGCGVALERIDEVVECGLEDREEAESHADESYTGSQPENMVGGGPAENEESGGKEDGADHHGWKASFRDGFVVVLLESADIEFVVPGIVSVFWSKEGEDVHNVGSTTNKSSKEDRKEWCFGCYWAPTSLFRKLYRDCC